MQQSICMLNQSNWDFDAPRIWFSNVVDTPFRIKLLCCHQSAAQNTRMKRFLVLISLLCLLAGCAIDHHTEMLCHAVWPTSKGAVADRSYDVPVFYGWPQRPYHVIGLTQLTSRRHEWKSSEIARAARLAKGFGQDALILRSGGEWDAIGQAAAVRHIVLPDRTLALAIGWTSQASVDGTSHRLEGFRAYLKRANPALRLESKNDLWELGEEYVAWLGLEIDSQPGTAKLEEALTSLIPPATDSAPSKWLFRGTIRENASTLETTVWGVATMSRAGENVSIVCADGDTRIAFAGLVKDDGLNGDLSCSEGPANLSAPAEGTLAQDKIVLNVRAQTDAGGARASFVFLR